ncbi:L,D-transpeptidase [Caldimonas tepidiphila]|uniref:L,D-transpeptidase n=1 Tax=Caldimonas tepidiphila TaxID=2315841 RepID=UPI001F0C23CF|nr:L,D-transpeptidase [Caldimonas tepidiphila]
MFTLAGTAGAVQPPAAVQVDFGGLRASADARWVAHWVMHSGDHGGLPFAIVDKKDARIFVFAPGGRLLGTSAALLGLAPGDHTVPGIGERPLSKILPHERTTPAGRFVSEPGRNLEGEHVVWVEYESGFAIHRVRPGSSRERREQRLKSASLADRRVSLGCVVVPVAFYEDVVLPALGRSRAIVYVLPETRPVHEVFAGMRDL